MGGWVGVSLCVCVWVMCVCSHGCLSRVSVCGVRVCAAVGQRKGSASTADALGDYRCCCWGYG